MVFWQRSFVSFLFLFVVALSILPCPAVAQTTAEVDEYVLFSRFSPAQRAGIYPTLDAETKSNLWRRHLELYLERNPELSARQWTLVQETMDLLTPELFADLRWPGSPEFTKAQEVIGEAAKRVREQLPRADKLAILPAAPPP